jgi:hypothetical protein
MFETDFARFGSVYDYFAGLVEKYHGHNASVNLTLDTMQDWLQIKF